MRAAFVLVLGLVVSVVPGLAAACDRNTGERQQRVDLRWNHQPVANWIAETDDIKRVDLPNGFALGVRIEPASAEKYAEMRKKGVKHPVELVHIQLYDLAAQPPRLLTYGWGGSNSLQGYGASGGADRVDELGDPGILMTLHKAVCAEAVASAQP